ncbi:hypothetical protein CHARACLAT_020026 [Characodon lateralis]|uniref:Uncharacterized protein n=1 Tax=Characodon lateralis TaxID=208331 RepID=A0ABU7DAQ8_9TELE|nr:hypothetical protein [Characodon lateralis]
MVRVKVLVNVKEELGYKTISQTLNPSQALFNLSSEDTRTWYLQMIYTQNVRLCKECFNDRRSQEVHFNSGGAAEIHSSGGKSVDRTTASSVLHKSAFIEDWEVEIHY